MTKSAAEEDMQLIERMGTDPARWADEFRLIAPEFVPEKLAFAWFHHAIEAGRNAERKAIARDIEQIGNSSVTGTGIADALRLPPGDWVQWLACGIRGAEPEDALLPCPLCGGDGYVGTIDYGEPPYDDDRCRDQLRYYQVNCSTCLMTVRGVAGYVTLREASKAWNRRPGADEGPF